MINTWVKQFRIKDKQVVSMFIDSANISVVVQGAIGANTEQCLQSVRKFLPSAEIILSTWVGTDTTDLDYDKLILNDNVEVQFYSTNPDEKVNNVNRQIVSTLSGLHVATRKYVLKIRTDFILKSAEFLEYFDLYNKSDSTYSVFKHKILSCTNFARNPRHNAYQYVFHPSDIAFFGLRTDLINLFDIPLMSKSDAMYHKIGGFRYNRYVPEQHIWVNCLRKNGHNIQFNRFETPSEKLIVDTEKYFVSSFIFLSWNQFGLVPPTRFTNILNHTEYDYISCITHSEWVKLYKTYLDKNVEVPQDDLRKNLVLLSKSEHHCKTIARIFVLFMFAFPKSRRKLRNYIYQFLCNIFLSKVMRRICKDL